MIKIIQRRKIWFAFSSLLVIISISALAVWGLRLGIDYTGGTLMEIAFSEARLDSQEIQGVFSELNLGEVKVQFSGEDTAFLRFKEVDEDTHQTILTALNNKGAAKLGIDLSEAQTDEDIASADENSLVEEVPVGQSPVQIEAQTADGENVNMEIDATVPEIAEGSEVITDTTTDSVTTEHDYVSEKSFESIGPVIGNELKTTTIWAVLIALMGIITYVAWAFRKVSYPVSSFKYGICATIALFHDIIITVGIFSILGHFYGVEVGVTFLAALLAILGYSVNDTIVVFDRTRENLLRGRLNDFEETVNNSVNETFARSINTSFTTLLMLFVLYIFGGASIQYFVLALIIGISFGTYSSIFIASPLLVAWQRFDAKKRG
ncbi:MAG: protein translocase subunit SecF [Candidatus Paceibacterota bacterium]